MPPQPVPPPVLCLASRSPRRRALLAQIGVPHVVSAAHIDEAVAAGERAADYVVRLARAKALAVCACGSELPVLAADTTVVIDEVICGKPTAEAEALAMLGRLSGRTHQVLTAVALVWGAGVAHRLSVSEVRFRTLSRSECRAYWASGEPRDKAGAYAVQGRAAVFIEHLAGSYSGVMGLPLFETGELLAAAGIAYWHSAAAEVLP
jgi:nucleoside triphosphate pyrophosphatase